jgi:hypothetical protein
MPDSNTEDVERHLGRSRSVQNAFIGLCLKDKNSMEPHLSRTKKSKMGIPVLYLTADDVCDVCDASVFVGRC